MSFQAYLDNIEAKTSKSPEEFIRLAQDKGSVRFPINQPIPYNLIVRIAAFKAQQITEEAIE